MTARKKPKFIVLDERKIQVNCTCDKGHTHNGGWGGCYFGGILIPACKCKWVQHDHA